MYWRDLVSSVALVSAIFYRKFFFFFLEFSWTFFWLWYSQEQRTSPYGRFPWTYSWDYPSNLKTFFFPFYLVFISYFFGSLNLNSVKGMNWQRRKRSSRRRTCSSAWPGTSGQRRRRRWRTENLGAASASRTRRLVWWYLAVIGASVILAPSTSPPAGPSSEGRGCRSYVLSARRL